MSQSNALRILPDRVQRDIMLYALSDMSIWRDIPRLTLVGMDRRMLHECVFTRTRMAGRDRELVHIWSSSSARIRWFLVARDGLVIVIPPYILRRRLDQQDYIRAIRIVQTMQTITTGGMPTVWMTANMEQADM